jgi:DNA-binding NarL/FixJ family response regulator
MIEVMAGRIVSPELIGREADLAILARALADATGQARTVLVGGEAGIGKSRLLAEALERARSEGALVLAGGCVGLADGSLPFAPIVEAIRPLVRASEELPADDDPAGRTGVLPDAALVALRSVAADLGLRGVSHVGVSDASELRPEWARSRLYEAVLELLRRLAEASPVVLAVEDLHWADNATLELLAFLVRNSRSERLLMVGTFRSDELHRRHPLLPWLAEVDRLVGVERIELGRLDRRSVMRQLTAILGEVPESQLAAMIYERSEGNPFFAEELIAAGAGSSRLPPTLREVLAGRLAGLSDRTHQLVGVAAIAGRRVDHDLLADVAGLAEPDLFAALHEATAAQLLVADDDAATERYAFRHALIAEAAADAVLPGERRRLHVAFAEALERQSDLAGAEQAGRLAEIAHHWIEARDVERGFEAALRAAEAAFDAQAYREALHQFERAVDTWELVSDPEAKTGFDRVELLRRAARAAQFAGRHEHAAALLREAIRNVDRASDPHRAGSLIERLGRALWTEGRIEESLAAYSEAADTVPAEPPTDARARVLAGYAQILMLNGSYRQSLRVAEEARAMAQAVDHRQVEGHATTTVATDMAFLGKLSQGIDLARTGLAISIEANDLDDIGRGHANLASLLYMAGRYEEAVDVSSDGARRMRDAGLSPTYGAYNELNAADAMYQLGRWDEASDLVQVVDAASLGVSQIYAKQVLSVLSVGRGDFDTARSALSDVNAMLGRGIDAQFNGPIALAALELAAWTGDVPGGRSAADAGLAVLGATEDVEMTVRVLAAALRLEADAAEVARAGRDANAEAVALERTERLSDLLRTMLARQPEGDPTALLVPAAALADAEAHRARGVPPPADWAAVADRFEAIRQPYPAAYARFREAEAALAARRDRDAVRRTLEAARMTAVDLGARPLLNAIDGLAARARLVLAVSAAATTTETAGPEEHLVGGYDLTPREIEVLRLLAAGRTNRQIADELFISESTAGVHVSHILGKLGVGGRVEAATIAARLGLAG